MMIVALWATCVSCVSQRKCYERFPPVTSSTVQTVTREIVRDNTLFLPADSAWLKALLACDSLGNVYLQRLEGYQAGERLPPPQLHLSNNLLTASATADSAAVFLRWKELHVLRDSVRVEVLPPVHITTNVLSSWQSFQLWAGRIALGLLALGLLVKLGMRK